MLNVTKKNPVKSSEIARIANLVQSDKPNNFTPLRDISPDQQ